MSGGVDSSVAAYLMKEKGYECAGVTMRLFGGVAGGTPKSEISDLGNFVKPPTDFVSNEVLAEIIDSADTSASGELNYSEKKGPSPKDAEDARSVAYKLGMPHYCFNYEGEFRFRVIDEFVASYLRGKTPNPCIDCNRDLKFGALMRRAKELGFDKVATGHYAKVEFDEVSGRWLLKRAADLSKDQSYVLYMLTQEDLSHIVFPLGDLTKAEVRKIAEAQGFLNAKKKESQDICFVPDGDYAGFIERYLNDHQLFNKLQSVSTVVGGPKFLKNKLRPDTENSMIYDTSDSGCAEVNSISREGDFIDPEGHVLGRHKGIIHYTIGQRKGLGISSDAPLFVTAIDAASNTVTLSHGEGLFSRKVIADDINLISVPAIDAPMRVTAKVRYRHKEATACAIVKGGRLEVTFDEPVRAVTAGQALVLYDGDIVVGGGTICCTEIR